MQLWGKNEETFSRQFTVPVFHQFHHQREKEAIIEAKPIIIRKLNSMIDDYVRGSQN